jgi:hypothetical protein
MLTNWQLRKYLAREVLGMDSDAPCVARQREGWSEAPHTGDRGLGNKGSDTQAIPLCPDRHTRGPLGLQPPGDVQRLSPRTAWTAREVRRLNAECEMAVSYGQSVATDITRYHSPWLAKLLQSNQSIGKVNARPSIASNRNRQIARCSPARRADDPAG